MTATQVLASEALAASVYEALDLATSPGVVEAILAQAEAACAHARHASYPQLEADVGTIRLYAQVRLRELMAKRESDPTCR